ncbi:hypothetical protein [Pseudonocardia broussonetiae]|uniref:Secreted protein n=1 Tax=Pseudonocardia broussonetiae TaxID=2736640 RepID=A0A6M6JHH6_9PSEU|nr:hypothetical protein [Pseudonocardia broussonetiae]QJY46633.1 hypothetical protein HOP40_13075 [Pseudonocardia broussonetiae]
MLTTLLIVAVIAAMATAAWALRYAQQLGSAVLDHDLQLGAVRERVHVTDLDVDRYHDRIHPACAETSDR